MKKFIKKILFVLGSISFIFLLEGLLPKSTFTYRPWEAMRYNSTLSMGRYFYPDAQIEMNSEGQFCHHTKNSVIRKEAWITDKLGNRNNLYIKNPDVLIIGDSNVVGSGVTQDSIIANQLKNELGNETSVYNIAPADFTDLDYYFKTGFLGKPKVIIFIRGERYIPSSIKKYNGANSITTKIKIALINNYNYSRISTFVDKIIRFYLRNWLQARLSNKNGNGTPGVDGSRMYFLNEGQETKQHYVVYELNDVNRVINNVISYKEYCETLGCEFIYVPVPKKETIYYDLVPYKKQHNTYLNTLNSLLVKNNIKTINTLNLYNNSRETDNKLLYQYDDPHWNSYAIQITAKELAKTINHIFE